MSRIERLQLQISHAEKRIRTYERAHGLHPNETQSYNAGFNLGYWKGKLAVYQAELNEAETYQNLTLLEEHER